MERKISGEFIVMHQSEGVISFGVELPEQHRMEWFRLLPGDARQIGIRLIELAGEAGQFWQADAHPVQEYAPEEGHHGKRI